MKNYLCSAFILLAMVSCDNKKEAVKTSYKTPDMKLASDVMTPEVLWSFGRIGGVSVSPDQKTLLYDVTYFNKEEDRSYSDIYVMNLADGKSKQLTDTDYKEFGETWTSDGKIAFMSSKSGSVQLWEMNADGSGLTQLTNVEGGIGGFIFSPDKSKLLFLKDVKLEQDVHDLHPDLPKANARLIDGQVYRHWNDWVEAYTHPFVADYIPGQMVTTGKDIMEGEKWEFVSSHTARRSFATNLYLRGADLYSISQMMGHASVEMTQNYLCCGLREQSAQVMEYFK